MAIRAALGAGRARIVRQLLTESIALSLVGGALGLGLGSAGIHALLTLYPKTPLGPGSVSRVDIPRIGEGGVAVSLDWRVLTFTLLIALVPACSLGFSRHSKRHGPT